MIERYLRHPSKEPDYRGGKGHGEFVTDLESVLGACDLVALKKTVESNLEFYLKDNFSEDLFSSQEKQRSHLLQKASKNTNIILSSQKMNEKIV